MKLPKQLELAHRLVAALEQDDGDQAAHLIGELNEPRSKAMLRQLAELTLEIKHALGGALSDPKLIDLTKNQMPDARERLRYVIEKTEEAAHRTLTAVEDMLPVADQLIVGADEVEMHLNATPGAEARDRFNEFCSASRAYGERLRSGLTEVLMAQEYQDLTGQVIKRTMEVVGEMEQRLIGVITHEIQAHSPDAAVVTQDPLRGQGPVLSRVANGANGQADVDDLLASLGV
jgi:chemotaxis protein CheZ